MIVGIIIAVVIVIIIVLCVRQALKGLKEAKERAMIKLGTIMKRDESVELPEATPDLELSAVQPASSNKKKLVSDTLELSGPSRHVFTPVFLFLLRKGYFYRHWQE